MRWHAWDGRETYELADARPLLDEELWPPLTAALRAARTRVELTQLLFEPGFAPAGKRLTDEIEAAARRGVRVRILLNENAAVTDSCDEMRERFAGTPVEVRALPMTPNVLHMKLFLVDDDAFLIDAPFEQKYADTRSHTFDTARRDGHKPFHSVSLRLRGPVIGRLAQLFDALWEDRPLAAPAPRPASAGVQLVWTAPAGVWAPEPAGGIVESYERALANARRFVYIESQYLTSPRIVQAIAAALAREPALEVILLLNEHMDIPAYDVWQERRLAELGYPEHPRLGVFSLWSVRRLEQKPAVRRIYVHSKIGIVDDEWLTMGSANLDSISLHEAEEWGFTAPRNIELNAVLTDADAVASLRRRLWGEHLGDEGVWSGAPPPGGWLAHWRRVAQRNLERFQAGEVDGAARVMPYASLTTSWRERLSRALRALT